MCTVAGAGMTNAMWLRSVSIIFHHAYFITHLLMNSNQLCHNSEGRVHDVFVFAETVTRITRLVLRMRAIGPRVGSSWHYSMHEVTLYRSDALPIPIIRTQGSSLLQLLPFGWDVSANEEPDNKNPTSLPSRKVQHSSFHPYTGPTLLTCSISLDDM